MRLWFSLPDRAHTSIRPALFAGLVLASALASCQARDLDPDNMPSLLDGPARPAAPLANTAPVINKAPDKLPDVVPVGKGSYASFPPPDAGAQALKRAFNGPGYVMNPDNRPIPTNHWWTNLITSQYVGQLWAFPLMVKANPRGIQVYYPNRWNDRGSDPVSDLPISVGGEDFSPADTRAKDWGDWTITFREAESEAKYMDVTLGRGLPYAWMEFHGIKPRLQLQGDATFFDGAGKTVTLPQTTDQLGIEYGGRCYGVFAPDNTVFSAAETGIAAEFAGPKSYLVICPLPSRADIATFHPYAFAIPRGSRMDWAYDPDAAQVTTTWKLQTEALKGTETRLIQGWLPHHYRDTINTLKLNNLTYLTPRGTLRCAVGQEFQITYPFNGIIPVFPAPTKTGAAHDYDETRMRGYVDRYAERTEYGDDTYWGGKHLLQYGEYMSIAHEIHDPAFSKLQNTLETALSDWFTYTPGEKAHYFARYPAWHALVGFKSSYGSEDFNDQHFHYGYFTTAAALLGMYDPQFLKDYGGVARLVAKEYANSDRTDPEFPFLRTFDVWEGHSWAGGMSGGTGDNQESSSEAMQSWGGLFLLGSALNDREMIAAGAMGYAMEGRAVGEYWFNIHGDNLPPAYGHPVVGMVWSGGNNYGTYFSGDPAWIYGIQWLPLSPIMSYLGRDPVFMQGMVKSMLAARQEKEGKSDIPSMGAALGDVILAGELWGNPESVAEQMDALWDSGSPAAHDNDMPGLVYYSAHSLCKLGSVAWNCHISIPTSCVYNNPAAHGYTYAVFNYRDLAQQASVYRDGKKIGEIAVPARTLVVTTTLK